MDRNQLGRINVGFQQTVFGNITADGITVGTATTAAAGHVNAVDLKVNGGSVQFTRRFTSTECAITAAGSLTLAHSLATTPFHVVPVLKCTNATGQHGYSASDFSMQFLVDHTSTGADNRGMIIVPDDTNLNVRYGAATSTFSVMHKTTGTIGIIDNTFWAMIFKAWT
jgi:hypothetical protein